MQTLLRMSERDAQKGFPFVPGSSLERGQVGEEAAAHLVSKGKAASKERTHSGFRAAGGYCYSARVARGWVAVRIGFGVPLKPGQHLET